jgi:glutathione synthase/RimK-type ligase-like ATP-grasp enzyme
MPIGRAALRLEREGIRIVFGAEAEGGTVTGFVAEPGNWRPVETVPVVGAYDRYPSKLDPRGHAGLRRGLHGLPLVNPLALTLLCRDKLECQRHLETRGLVLPEVEADPARFADRLGEWGAGFLKPRYGAYGVGVRRVVPGAPLPTELPGAVAGAPEPSLLQRAVTPPEEWAGISVRVLVQRGPDGIWMVNPGVARRSATDPVVNVARGAEAAPAGDVLSESSIEALHTLVRTAADALSDHPDGVWLAELGVDAVVDAVGRPWIIEVNSRPRGRLECLAEADPARFHAAHVEACARPIRFLAARAG